MIHVFSRGLSQALWLSCALLWVLMISCSEKADPPEEGPQDVAVQADSTNADIEEAIPPTSGDLSVLTYNVAGLPQGLSGSNPETNIPIISPLLNPYDLALIQEDFWYYKELRAEAEHPFISEPYTPSPDPFDMGDGLNRFSQWPFDELIRTPWPGCNGELDCSSDCLASKGSSVARHTLADGVEVDVYNLHMEAGGCPQDGVIRAQSIDQLLEMLEERSSDVAVIMAGDFNLHESDPEELALLNKLIDEANLTDACWATECNTPRIDRILVRGTSTLSLEPTGWEIPPAFVTSEGEDLSDHEPVAATLHWEVISER
jgi:hypothetical protein